MNPDLGQHFWQTGFANKRVIVIGADFQMVSEAPKNTCDVTFMVTLGDQRYCGTLNTKQQIQTIDDLVKSGERLMVEGRLARGSLSSQSGQTYRLIIGALKPVPHAD